MQRALGLVKAGGLEPGNEADREGVKCKYEDGMVQSLSGQHRDTGDEHLHEHDGASLRREFPHEPLELDESHKDGEAEGVVHAGGSFEHGERDGDRLSGLFQREGNAGYNLGGIRSEGREHEGDVEAGHAEA